jgi:hypothetical protein
MGQGMSRSLGKVVNKCLACGRLMDAVNLDEVAELPSDRVMRLARNAGAAVAQQIAEEHSEAMELIALLG